MRRQGRTGVRSALAVTIALSAACSEGTSPTEPAEPLDPVRAAELLPSVDDAGDRLREGILDPTVAAELAAELDALERHFASGDRARAGEAIEAAAQVLGAYAGRGMGSDAPDVAAIQLTLAHAAALVGVRLSEELIP